MDDKDLLVVVDRYDNILGFKTRSECHRTNKLIHRLIGIIIFNKEGKILLQQRSNRKDSWPNFYTLSVSGHVLKGETYQKAAKRELVEELGIDIKVKMVDRFLLIEKERSHIATLFTADYNQSIDRLHINKEELNMVKFFTADDIKKMTSTLTPFALKSLKLARIL